MENIKSCSFSKSSQPASQLKIETFSKFILSNFKIGSKYCLFLRIKSYKNKFIVACATINLEVLKFNKPES